MLRYETVIWDFNGTILNDTELCIDIANKILRKEKLTELTEDRYKEVFGFPITSYYERIGIDFEKTSMEYLTKEFISSYTASVKNCKVHDEIENILTDLDKQGKSQFILTAAHTEMATGLLNHFEILNYFKAVVGLDNHRAESKIDKGKELIKTYKVNLDTAVLIGDTLHDYEVAKALGIHCILVANGHQSKNRLEHGVDDTVQVLERIDQLRG